MAGDELIRGEWRGRLAADPPRVWTAFAALGAALVGLLFLQAIIGAAFVIWYVAAGGNPQQFAKDLPTMLSTPAMLMALALASQLAFGLAAVVPACLSPQPAKVRLGLVKAALPSWSYPIVALGAWAPLAVGVALAYAITPFIKPDESIARLYEAMTPAMAGPFILFIALVPGFMEELLFRGYMQRRLLERWSPASAIAVVSALFALMHVMPHAMLAALPLGIWFGVLAWRTGSVWPGIVCHAFVNGSWNILHIGAKFAGITDTTKTIIAIVALAIGIPCFIVSLRNLKYLKSENAPICN